MEKERFKKLSEDLLPSLKMKLEAIRKYLHENKASLMVGAGFSKNADMDESTTMKDWFGLADDFYETLYGNRPNDKDVKYKSVLRLASQVESSKGRCVLESLIQNSLPDHRVYPGRLHVKLMGMPWTDVFTTNYDTLLEKAFVEADRYYHKVTNKETLLYAPHPRIVKLHGSFPDIRPFIITEEDFRTYPQKFPELVNTVRQSLIENVMCLIGFSGDDPNFQSWLGWLRDVMGKQIAPVYQITYNKTMHESNVKLSYDLGIDVVNLAEIPGVKDFTEALDFCLEYIDQPFETQWKPSINILHKFNGILNDSTKSKDDIANELSDTVQKMREIRSSYPGWYVLPKKYYNDFNDVKVEYPYLNRLIQVIKDDAKLLVDFMYEINWRYAITLSSLDFEWYVKTAEELPMFISEDVDADTLKKIITLKESLLTVYRYRNDGEAFTNLASQFSSLSSYLTYEHERVLFHEHCFFYLGRLDHVGVENLLQKWTPRSYDYKGYLWKAGIIAEIGREKEAISILRDTLKDIKKNILGSKHSKALLSTKKAIEHVLWLMSLGHEEMPTYDEDYKPSELFRFFTDSITKSSGVKESILTTHSFGLFTTGTQYNSGENGFVGSFLGAYRYIRLYEELGLPLSNSSQSRISGDIVDAVVTLMKYNPEFAYMLFARGAEKSVIEKKIDRSCFSYFSREQVLRLFEVLYPMAKNILESEPSKPLRYRLFVSVMPLLSLLSVLLPSEKVKDIFELWLILYKRHSNAFNGKYVEQLYQCMNDNDLHSCQLMAFDLPILTTGNGVDFCIPNRNLSEQEINNDALIEAMKKLQSDNSQFVSSAYQRIVYLMNCKLDETSKAALQTAIINWRKPDYDTLEKKHSITVVPLLPPFETVKEGKIVDDILNSFIGTDFKTSGSSVSISSFTQHLHTLSFFTTRFTEKQHTLYVEKIIKTLSENEELFKNDDSNSFMGGLRHFVHQIFPYISAYMQMAVLPNNGNPIWNDFVGILLKYHSHGYATLQSYTKLQLLRGKANTQLKNMIGKCVLSNDKVLAKDACEALVVYSEKKKKYTNQSIIKDLIHYIRYTEDDIASGVYLGTLIRVLVNGGICKEAKELLLSWIEGFAIHCGSSKQWTATQCDMLYHANVLAGVISVKWPDWSSLESWKQLMENDNVFNDIRHGFEVGCSIASR